ncbi:heavy-metal-associated domain-containing protein, partial [Alloalcanivorax profundimaris]
MSKNCGGPCGDDARPAADTDMQASSDASGEWVSVYAVPKMDCPSEERMIRLALNGVEGIRALSFDLSNRRVKVVHDGEVEPVTSKLKTLELGASLQESVAADPETIKAAEFSAASAKQESGTLRWLLGI